MKRDEGARRWLAIVSVIAVWAALSFPLTVMANHWSPPPTVWIESTGHTADRLFLDVWRSNPGFLGDPITEEFRGRSGFVSQPDVEPIVQYYRNLALTFVSDAPAGEQVRSLQLGQMALAEALKVHPTASLQRADTAATCDEVVLPCLEFETTEQTVRGPFLTYWEANAGERWLGNPLTEAFRMPDGSMVQFFENGALRLTADQVVRPLPLGEQLAKLQKLDTRPIPRPADVPAFVESLFDAPPEPEPVEEDIAPVAKEATADTGWGVGSFGPGPQQGAWKEIVVSISAQEMWAYENGELVTSSYVSTGIGAVPETVTPIGTWSILSKYDVQTMAGVIADEEYLVPDVPDVMYFDNLGNALHGAYWHNNFGTPMSHGCINLPLDIAAFLYSWAPVGTAVSVIG